MNFFPDSNGDGDRDVHDYVDDLGGALHSPREKGRQRHPAAVQWAPALISLARAVFWFALAFVALLWLAG